MGLLGLAVFAVFFRSLDFFDGTRVINEWHFLQPKDALAAFELTFNISLFPAAHAIAGIIPRDHLSEDCEVRYWRQTLGVSGSRLHEFRSPARQLAREDSRGAG